MNTEHMTDSQKLDLLIATMSTMNSRLDKIDTRLNVLEYKQEITQKKLDNLTVEVMLSERKMLRSIHELNDKTDTIIAVLELNDILPLTK